MALRINGMTGRYIVPNVLSRKYRCRAFEGTTLVYTVKSATGKVEQKSVDAKQKIDDAWKFIVKEAATHKPCNDYFKTLSRKKTLKEILDEGDITLHRLEPKEGYTYNEIPDAIAAGRDIGINPSIILFDETRVLAAILIHELAHVAGASTNPDPDNPKSGDAEKALLHCKCQGQYRKEALGTLLRIGLPGQGKTRLA